MRINFETGTREKVIEFRIVNKPVWHSDGEGWGGGDGWGSGGGWGHGSGFGWGSGWDEGECDSNGRY